MDHPRRRKVERFIHVDSRDFPGITESSYNICFGPPPTNNLVPTGSAYIPIQDYNNVIKLELKAFISEKPLNEDYVIFKIKNVDGKVDTTTGVVDASTVCYFDPTTIGKKPIYFGGTEFEFNPPIAKLSKLQVDIITRNGTPCSVNTVLTDDDGNGLTDDDGNDLTTTQSFLLKITYIEGNLY